mgnify:FL=1|tara:strand:+ start:93 stop:593 length:501 start_codon:yes stop_codon:yes gene_type:complete
MKNKTHLNMPGFKLPHISNEKQVGPYDSALHAHTPGHNEPSFAPVSTPPSFHETFASSGGEVREIDKDSLASDRYYEKVFNEYMSAEKDPRFGNPSEKDRWREFLMENYSTRFNPAKGRGEIIEASNPEPGQDVFPSEADVQAVDPKFRIPERFSWEAYNKKFPRK